MEMGVGGNRKYLWELNTNGSYSCKVMGIGIGNLE